MSYSAIPLRISEHRERLGSLWAESMSDARIAAAIPARMRWLYEESPEGAATTMLAVVAETGEVVGCGSVIPRGIWVGGRRVRGGLLCDFATARSHRNAGAAVTLQRALLQAVRAGGTELVYGYPNDKSIAVFKRVGCRTIGATTTWVKPLRSGYKLRQMLSSSWATAVAAAPLDLGLRAVDLARGLRAPRLASTPLDLSDGRADALWERAHASYGVIGEKSGPYLRWRYERFPTAPHSVFGVAAQGGDRLAAYAVFAVEAGKAFVRDVFAEPAPGVLERLFLALGDHLRGLGVDSMSLSYVGGPEFGARLRCVGFVRRPATRPVIVGLDALDESLRAAVTEPSRWFMLDGELDI